MSKLSNIALRKIAAAPSTQDKARYAGYENFLNMLVSDIEDPAVRADVLKNIKSGMFDSASESGIRDFKDVLRKRLEIVQPTVEQRHRVADNAIRTALNSRIPKNPFSFKETLNRMAKKDVFGRPLEQTMQDKVNAAVAKDRRNSDALWSYGGATVGGGALGALLGGEGNRLKGAIIGALLANAANFGRRKWKYGNDVIA